ncbi:MAG: RagB/SusD family nutrient uptake outer membrane protein [Candidatus Ordinivivax streblomastigis]|uniref:RagB/SusD family nutrient uptake outer membrane protein n=1 Tax=Candidatus Ordinivivax streblomastigis TaxID=2540710 RepID=A0A5M8NU69_9BACT|nr:MAG: RagB/SusD family nutrient uptake outer membrane protein [Candidatus Ordinivivax streblomastigis]
MKYKSKILYFILATLSLSSCSDFLDQVPDEKLSEEILFDSKDDVIRIITQIYYNQGNPLGFGNSEIDDIPGTSGDDVDYIWNNYSPYKKDLGQYSASSPIYKQWRRYYESIRLAMYFIGKIDTCNDPKLLENEKQWWKGEAYFLEAYYYFILLQMYGPVPILDKIYEPGEVESAVASGAIYRASFDDCVKHIDNLLEEAYNLLDVFYTSSSTERAGRASKASAKFLQARLWLYAASPLYNGMVEPISKENFSALSPKDANGETLINIRFDADKWKKAMDVAAEAIRVCEQAGRSLYKDANGYTSCWKIMNYARGGEPVVENIFYRQNYSTGTIRTHSLPIFWSGYSGICPTLEHVNEYFMANGLLPEDDEAFRNYKITEMDTYSNEGKTFTIPKKFTNRDPRFYVNILFPGQYSYAVLGNENTSTATR